MDFLSFMFVLLPRTIWTIVLRLLPGFIFVGTILLLLVVMEKIGMLHLKEKWNEFILFQEEEENQFNLRRR